MISQILTACVIGLDVYKILVEVDINNSLPAVSIVGLPDLSITEARERVRSAIKNSGYSFPNKKANEMPPERAIILNNVFDILL